MEDAEGFVIGDVEHILTKTPPSDFLAFKQEVSENTFPLNVGLKNRRQHKAH